MGLSTVTLFKQDFPNTDYTDVNIGNAINLATTILENHCNRNFERKDYIDYINGSGDNSIILKNYPIVKVSDISPDIYHGIQLTVGSAVYSCNYSSTSTAITFNVIDFDGTEVESELLYATYPRMSELVVAINLLDNLTATLTSQYDNEPSRKIKPDNGLIISGQTDWISFYKSDLQLKWLLDPQTDNVIKVDRGLSFGYENVYVKYSAGYIYPSDSPLVSGNVPLDLTNICNKLVYTLLVENDEGIKSGIFKSENLGDYSYTRFDHNNSVVNQLLLDENQILSKYIYKELTW